MLVQIVTFSFAAVSEDEQPFGMQQPAAAQRQAAIIFHNLYLFIAMPPTLIEINVIEYTICYVKVSEGVFSLEYGRMTQTHQHKALFVFRQVFSVCITLRDVRYYLFHKLHNTLAQ